MKEARITKPALQNRFVLKPSTAKAQGANVPFYVVQVRSWTSSSSLVWIWLIDELYWWQWAHPGGAGLWFTCWVYYAIFPPKIQSLVIRGRVYYYYSYYYCYCWFYLFLFLLLKYVGFPWGKMAGSMEGVVTVGSYCTCSSGILPALQPCCHQVLLPQRPAAITSYCHEVSPSCLQRSGTSESVLSCAQSPNTFCLLWNKWLEMFAEWLWNEHVG